ncbi:MAG TPA: maltose phosphorylase, partial [Lachnoclostridium sp.]|nr:maltose phosphorylase [Lachnoclostridium sp.]
MNLTNAVKEKYKKPLASCTNEEIYLCLLEQVKKLAKEKENASAQETALAKETASGKRKLYYISAEFLIGKLLSNNLINLGLYDEVKKELEAAGKSLAEIEELEPEPSLGNGGLGRLAACFVDSIATLGLNGDGVGLNYHYGLFKQVFDKKHLQQETPNPWMEKESWLTKTGTSYQVPFGGFTVTSRLYDMDVTGYDNHST